MSSKLSKNFLTDNTEITVNGRHYQIRVPSTHLGPFITIIGDVCRCHPKNIDEAKQVSKTFKEALEILLSQCVNPVRNHAGPIPTEDWPALFESISQITLMMQGEIKQYFTGQKATKNYPPLKT